MVSFRNILFLVTAALATVSEARSIGHKRYGRLHARHAFHNGTLPAPVEGYPGTSETGVEGYPMETVPVPHGTGIESYPTAAPVPDHEGETPSEENTTCITYYETKVVTYTLGNGHAVTTTFVQTNVVTQTLAPAHETPVDQAVPTTAQDAPVVTVVPVPVDNDYENGNTQEEPGYDWTSTSTTTVLYTITRVVPYPEETLAVDSPAVETPCVVATVTVTAGAQETVTIKETVKETITVTAGAGPVETISPIVQEPVEEPVEVPAPGYEESPVDEAPVEEAPVEESPVEESPVEESPVEEYPEVPTHVPAHPPYGNFTGNYTIPTTTHEPVVVTVVPVPAY